MSCCCCSVEVGISWKLWKASWLSQCAPNESRLLLFQMCLRLDLSTIHLWRLIGSRGWEIKSVDLVVFSEADRLIRSRENQRPRHIPLTIAQIILIENQSGGSAVICRMKTICFKALGFASICACTTITYISTRHFRRRICDILQLGPWCGRQNSRWYSASFAGWFHRTGSVSYTTCFISLASFESIEFRRYRKHRRSCRSRAGLDGDAIY